MNTTKKLNRLFHSPYFWGFIVILLIVRATAPAILLKETNKILAKFSDVYHGHIEDFDIHILRGAYGLDGLRLRLKKNSSTTKGGHDLGPEFVFIKNLDVSIAWREILVGKFNTDIIVDEMKLMITNNLIDVIANNKKQSEKDSKLVASKLFPIHIGRIDIRNSSFEFAELLSVPEASRWKMTEMNGRISNVTSTPETPLSLLSFRGKLFNSSEVKVAGNLNMVKTPAVWDFDLVLKDFNLPNANAWLKRKLPLTFTSGKLDLYSEVRYENNKIEGYAKPFLHKADIVATGESFTSLKHFAIEISTAAANLILRTARDKTLATKILFSYENNEFNINSKKAISEAIKNGFSEKIPEGVDDEISLSKKNLGGLPIIQEHYRQ